MLVNIEQGSANPSIAILLKLSEALGVGLSELVESPRPTAVKLTRSGTGPVLWSGDAGGRAVSAAGEGERERAQRADALRGRGRGDGDVVAHGREPLWGRMISGGQRNLVRRRRLVNAFAAIRRRVL